MELLLDPQQVVLEESEQQVVLVSPLVQQQELSSWLQEQEQPQARKLLREREQPQGPEPLQGQRLRELRHLLLLPVHYKPHHLR